MSKQTTEEIIRVTVQRMSRGREQDSEVTEYQDVRRFLVEPAYVKVGAQRRMDLGNYESLQVTVEITTPCYVEEVAKTTKSLTVRAPELIDKTLEDWSRELGYSSNK